MKDVYVGEKVFTSLEYYIKANGQLLVPPCGTVIDVNGRIVTVEDTYGHSWNIDRIYLEQDNIDDVEITNGDKFNDKVIKSFMQTFINEEDLDIIDEKVTKYFDEKINPFDTNMEKTIIMLRSIEKYSMFAEFSEETEAKVEYLYDLLSSFIEETNQDISGSNQNNYNQGRGMGGMKEKEDGPINPLDYLTDMTKVAKENPYDKCYGREKEIKEVMRYIKHRDKKNAILVGKQGCGKTTIIEELANRVAAGEVPALKGKRILAMDVDGMIAGTKYRGMFEERCKAVLQYCANEKDVIVFIDEVHKIMGAGGNTEGGMNLGNLMKTYLTKGISVIGATTYDEYAHLKDDAALARRFGIVTIEEQEPEVVKWILGQVKEDYEDFHGVQVNDTLLSAIVDTFDQKNYNTAGIDYAKNSLDSICTIMEMDGVSQSKAYAEFMDGQNYDKEENNSYVKKGKLGFGIEDNEEKTLDKKEEKKKLRSPEVQKYIDLMEEEEKEELKEMLNEEEFNLVLEAKSQYLLGTKLSDVIDDESYILDNDDEDEGLE